MTDTAPRFDHDWRLAELLDGKQLAQLGPQLEELLGSPVVIEDAEHRVLWGLTEADARRVPLVLEFEPLGYLASKAPDAALNAACRLVRQHLQVCLRFRMASSLHQEAMAEDYAALRQEHTLLMASEARYKALASQLEDKVREQVVELQVRQERLFQAARLASVGQLAAGVAHEINNPLGFMRSNLSTLVNYLHSFAALKHQPESCHEVWQSLGLDFVLEDSTDIVTECLQGLDRIAVIVQDLKTFSNIDQDEWQTCDLNACLSQAANQLLGLCPENVVITLQTGILPTFRGMPGHLNQAFLNVMRNGLQAIDASHGPGELRVRSEKGQQAILITIEDNGVGMDEIQLEHAFDPFFTTRSIGSGKGLGLTSARNIVLAHGGQIRLNSRPGFGTSVNIELPLP